MMQSNVNVSKPNIGSGLYNLGNSCFMNATLQCLAYSKLFAKALIFSNHSKQCNKKDFCTLCEMKKLLSLMLLNGRSNTQKPLKLFKNINEINGLLTPGCQEDAHEFYQSLLDKMEIHFDETKNVNNNNHNPIRDLFKGETMTEIFCSECRNISSKKEPFNCISLEVGKYNLYESLDLFTNIEILRGTEKYFCSHCNKKCVAGKKITISKLPKIFSIHLKRFSTTFDKNTNQIITNKLNHFIQFPEILDLSKKNSKIIYNDNNNNNNNNFNSNLKYSLYAVLVHKGSNLGYGHYYALVKLSNNQWYKMDDNKIIPIHDISHVLKENAYILFYQQMNYDMIYNNDSNEEKEEKEDNDSNNDYDYDYDYDFDYYYDDDQQGMDIDDDNNSNNNNNNNNLNINNSVAMSVSSDQNYDSDGV